MKLTTTIAIIFSVILFSCKKESISDLPKETKEIKEIKTAGKPGIDDTPKYVTIKTVLMYCSYNLSIGFTWEILPTGTGNGYYVSNFHSGGTGGSSGNLSHQWAQTNVWYSSDPSNPNSIKFMIKATDSYSQPSRFGVDHIVNDVITEAIYNTKTNVWTTVSVYVVASHIVN